MGEAMARLFCNAEQALTLKLIPTLAVLFLVSVAVLTPAGALAATQPHRPQLQNMALIGAAGYDVDEARLGSGP